MADNIGDFKHVILKQARELPKEVCFQLSNAKQDPVKLNRYWFNFPAQWSNRYAKDSIIGIRNVYLTKTNLLIMYRYTIILVKQGTADQVYSADGIIKHFLDGNDTIRQICECFDKWWISELVVKRDDIGMKWVPYELLSTFEYDEDNNRMTLNFGRGPGDTEYIIRNDIKYTPIIKIDPLNDDTENLLGIDYKGKQGIGYVSFNVWSRFNCYITSSLAQETDSNSFLAHTGNRYNPIKYYRLNGNDKKFWIELYETRFHSCPVIIPKRDDLFIESVVLFSTEGII